MGKKCVYIIQGATHLKSLNVNTIVDDEFIKTFCGQSVDIYLTMCLVSLFFDRALGL